MITVIDMATGEILQRGEPMAAPACTVSNMPTDLEIPQLALQEVQPHRPEVHMPPDLDIAEVLATLR